MNGCWLLSFVVCVYVLVVVPAASVVVVVVVAFAGGKPIVFDHQLLPELRKICFYKTLIKENTSH